jgi:hypothetical protein
MISFKLFNGFLSSITGYKLAAKPFEEIFSEEKLGTIGLSFTLKVERV